MSFLGTKHAALVREDLRSELQEFLHDVRREVSEQVCISLLPELRELVSESRRRESAGRGSTQKGRKSSDDTPRSLRFGLEVGPRTSRELRTDPPVIHTETLENETADRSSTSPMDFAKTGTSSFDCALAEQRKSNVSLKSLQEEAQKLTETSFSPHGTDKTYIMLPKHGDDDDDMHNTNSTRLSRVSHVQSQSKFRNIRRAVKSLVKSRIFERLSGLAVIANAVSFGYDTQYWADHRGNQKRSPITAVTERGFCVLFTTELSLRAFAFGCHFFMMETWYWNMLDTFLVLSQLSDQVLQLVSTEVSKNLEVFTMMRVLRIIRVTRLLRSFHLFDDLRVLVSSIISSASSLGWSLILLGILMYIFTLVFLELVLNAGETEHGDAFLYWFGSLFRTYYTLFECIAGGVSWDEIAAPLMEDIGPVASILFSLYIAISIFAMMNLLTGVFVEKAMKTVREDKDVVLANRIRDLFLGGDPDEREEAHPEITLDIFLEMLETSVMQDYLNQINVELRQGRALFALLDADGSGNIDSDEIVAGCLKLRGPARSLDLALLSKDVYNLTIIANEMRLYMVQIMHELFIDTSEANQVIHANRTSRQSQTSRQSTIQSRASLSGSPFHV